MTPEDRRLVAALTTEVAEYHRALEALVKEIEHMCGIFIKDPKKIPAYNEARRLLK